MKNNLLAVLFMILVLSCNSSKNEASRERSVKDVTTSDSMKQVQEDANVRSFSTTVSKDISELKYFFANDSLCQTLTIKRIAKSKSNEIPKELKFKLTLRDKLNRLGNKEFDGVAKLFSSEESFYDSSDKNGADYFAGDYRFKTKDYEIKIRVDIENYEASVIGIATKQPHVILEGYANYLKTFPNQGVMKKGECTK